MPKQEDDLEKPPGIVMRIETSNDLMFSIVNNFHKMEASLLLFILRNNLDENILSRSR